MVTTESTPLVAKARLPKRTFNWMRVIPYFFILPTFVLLIAVRYVPTASAIWHSFTDWDGITQARYTGLKNYLELFRDQVFVASLRNMTLYTVVRTVVVTVLSFFAAELVYSVPSRRLQTLWKVIFIVPMVIPGTVGYLVWAFVYNTQDGILNRLMGALGFESLQRAWLGESVTALWALIFIGFPFIASFSFLIYVSSLQNLSAQVMDAACVDGCGPWRRVFAIDIPLMRGPLALTIILLVLDGIQVLMPQLVLTGGGPGTATESPASYLYRSAFHYGEFGYATAIGVVMLAIGLVFSYFSIRLRYRGAADVE